MQGENITCVMCDWFLDDFSYWELSNRSLPDGKVNLCVLLFGKFKLVMMPFEILAEAILLTRSWSKVIEISN